MDAVAFFEAPDTATTLGRLARERPLTIVVGAGASMESNLPDWRALVESMLTETAARLGLGEQDARQFVDWTLARDGVTAAGAVAQALLGAMFQPSLAAALYRDVPEPYHAHTARAVARLRLTDSSSADEVVTTNYDDLIEQALRERLENTRDAAATGGRRLPLRRRRRGPHRVRSATDGSVQEVDEVVVRHLHGMLRPDGDSAGSAVLSEADYHLMQDASAWQETYSSGGSWSRRACSSGRA